MSTELHDSRHYALQQSSPNRNRGSSRDPKRLQRYKSRKQRPIENQLRALREKLGDMYKQNDVLYQSIQPQIAAGAEVGISAQAPLPPPMETTTTTTATSTYLTTINNSDMGALVSGQAGGSPSPPHHSPPHHSPPHHSQYGPPAALLPAHAHELLQSEWEKLRRREREIMDECTHLRAELASYQDKVARTVMERDEMRTELDRQRAQMEDELQMRSDALANKYKVLIGNVTESTLKEKQDIRSLRQSVQDSEVRLMQYAEQLEWKSRQVIQEYQDKTGELLHQIQQERLLLQEREFEISREADRVKINALNDVNYTVFTAVEKCNARVAELEAAMQKERSQSAMNYKDATQRGLDNEQQVKQRLQALTAIYQQLNANHQPYPTFANLSDPQRKVLEMEVNAHCNNEISDLRQQVQDLQLALKDVKGSPSQHLAEREELELAMRHKINTLIQRNNQNVRDIDAFYSTSERKHREQTLMLLRDMEAERASWKEEATKRFREMETSWEADKMELLQQLSEVLRGGKVGADVNTFQQRCGQLINNLKNFVRTMAVDGEQMAMLMLQLDDVNGAYMADLNQLENVYAVREVESRNKYEGRLTQLSTDYRTLQDKLNNVANDKASKTAGNMLAEINYLNQLIDDVNAQEAEKGEETSLLGPGGIGGGDIAELTAQLRREKQSSYEREVGFSKAKAEWAQALQAQSLNDATQTNALVQYYQQLYEMSEQRRGDEMMEHEQQIKELYNNAKPGNQPEAQHATGQLQQLCEYYKQLYESSEKRRMEEQIEFRNERSKLLTLHPPSSSSSSQVPRPPSTPPTSTTNSVGVHIVPMATTNTTPTTTVGHGSTPATDRGVVSVNPTVSSCDENGTLKGADTPYSDDKSVKIDGMNEQNLVNMVSHYRKLHENAERRLAEERAAWQIEKNRLIAGELPPAAVTAPGGNHYRDMYENTEKRRAEDAANFEIERARLYVSEKPEAPPNHYQQLYELTEVCRTRDAAANEIEKQRLHDMIKQMQQQVHGGDSQQDFLVKNYRDLYEAAEARRSGDHTTWEREKKQLMSALVAELDATKDKLRKLEQEKSPSVGSENSASRLHQEIDETRQKMQRLQQELDDCGDKLRDCHRIEKENKRLHQEKKEDEEEIERLEEAVATAKKKARMLEQDLGGSPTGRDQYKKMYLDSETQRHADQAVWNAEKAQLLAQLAKEHERKKPPHGNNGDAVDLMAAVKYAEEVHSDIHGTITDMERRQGTMDPSDEAMLYQVELMERLKTVDGQISQAITEMKARTGANSGSPLGPHRRSLSPIKSPPANKDDVLRGFESRIVILQQDVAEQLADAEMKWTMQKEGEQQALQEYYQQALQQTQATYEHQFREEGDRFQHHYNQLQRAYDQLQTDARSLDEEWQNKLGKLNESMTERLQEAERDKIANEKKNHQMYKQLMEEREQAYNSHVTELTEKIEHLRTKLRIEDHKRRIAEEDDLVTGVSRDEDDKRDTWLRDQTEVLDTKRHQMDLELQEEKLQLKKEMNQKLDKYKDELRHNHDSYKQELEAREKKYRNEFEDELRKQEELRIENMRQVLEQNHKEKSRELEARHKQLETDLKEREYKVDTDRLRMEDLLRMKYESQARAEIDANRAEFQRKKDALEDGQMEYKNSIEDDRRHFEKQLMTKTNEMIENATEKLDQSMSEQQKRHKEEIQKLTEKLLKKELQLKSDCLKYEEEVRSQYLQLMEERDNIWQEQEQKRTKTNAEMWERVRLENLQHEKDLEQKKLAYEKELDSKYNDMIVEYHAKAREDLLNENKRLIDERENWEKDLQKREEQFAEDKLQSQQQMRDAYEDLRKKTAAEHDEKVQQVKKALEKEIAAVDQKIIDRERELEKKLLTYEEEIRKRYTDKYYRLEQALHAEIEAYNNQLRGEREEQLEREQKMWAIYDMGRMEFEEATRQKYEEAMRQRDMNNMPSSARGGGITPHHDQGTNGNPTRVAREEKYQAQVSVRK